MKLPNINQIKTAGHTHLWEHDIHELHAENPKDFKSRFYRNRFNTVLKLVKNLQKRHFLDPAEVKILDVGCAQANFGLTFAELGYRSVAVDLRPEFLEYAKMKYEKGTFYPIAANLEKMPFRSNFFDIVFAGEIIEHVAHPDHLLRTLYECCRPGGFVIVTTPNGSRLFSPLPTLSKIKNRDLNESRQFQPDGDGHLYLLTKSELLEEGKKASLRFVKHKFYASPWVTGRLKFRLFVRFLPVALANFLDFIFIHTPGICTFFTEAQIAVFKKP